MSLPIHSVQHGGFFESDACPRFDRPSQDLEAVERSMTKLFRFFEHSMRSKMDLFQDPTWVDIVVQEHRAALETLRKFNQLLKGK
jgi:hypothetical protein